MFHLSFCSLINLLIICYKSSNSEGISLQCGKSRKEFVCNAQCVFQMAVMQVLWAFQMMISTALLAKVLTTLEKKPRQGPSLCDERDPKTGEEYKYTCGQLTGGVVSIYTYDV